MARATSWKGKRSAMATPLSASSGPRSMLSSEASTGLPMPVSIAATATSTMVTIAMTMPPA